MTHTDRDDNRLRVLLVEDSLVDAHLIMAILDSEARYQVTLAQDGMRGTLLATEQAWDLIITDLNLPGDSGLALIRTAKEHHSEVPILTTTGYTAPKYTQSAFREGADAVLMKPVEREDLLKKLLYLLGATRIGTAGPTARTILAVSARPGDAEFGCGGILWGHTEHRHKVVMLVLTETDGSDVVREAGADPDGPLVVKEVAASPGAFIGTIVTAVREHDPDTLYVPTGHDSVERRAAAHRAGVQASLAVPNVYCYQTASSTTEFNPTVFIGVDDYMDGKIALVGTYPALAEADPAYSPEMIRSTARYWGRFDSYANVEPLEVVRSEI